MITKNKEANFVSAVVYLYNNSDHVTAFLEMLNGILTENFKSHEIIVVNDKSTDSGVDNVRRFAAENVGSTISILNMSYRQGLERAMRAGVELAIGDFVYEFDTVEVDYSSDVIMNVYRESLSGYDIVSASANIKGCSMSRLFYSLLNKNANLQYEVATETFRILSRRAINRSHSISHTIPYRKAIYANCGLRVKSLKYKSLDKNKHKKRQMVIGEKFELAMSSLILFTDIAYKLTLTFAVLMSLFTLGVGIYAIAFYFMGSPVQGWTTTILFLSFSFGGLFIIMAMVVKYLSILVKLNFEKKDYLFESIEKL